MCLAAMTVTCALGPPLWIDLANYVFMIVLALSSLCLVFHSRCVLGRGAELLVILAIFAGAFLTWPTPWPLAARPFSDTNLLRGFGRTSMVTGWSLVWLRMGFIPQS